MSLITQDMISLLDKWRHTGSNVFFGPHILPRYEKSMGNLTRHIIRVSFSQERNTYHRKTGQVEYQSKDEKETRVFDALEWLVAMCSHVPDSIRPAEVRGDYLRHGDKRVETTKLGGDHHACTLSRP
jgi:hypothetical protein